MSNLQTMHLMLVPNKRYKIFRLDNQIFPILTPCCGDSTFLASHPKSLKFSNIDQVLQCSKPALHQTLIKTQEQCHHHLHPHHPHLELLPQEQEHHPCQPPQLTHRVFQQ